MPCTTTHSWTCFFLLCIYSLWRHSIGNLGHQVEFVLHTWDFIYPLECTTGRFVKGRQDLVGNRSERLSVKLCVLLAYLCRHTLMLSGRPQCTLVWTELLWVKTTFFFLWKAFGTGPCYPFMKYFLQVVHVVAHLFLCRLLPSPPKGNLIGYPIKRLPEIAFYRRWGAYARFQSCDSF